ncbi:MAG: energy transducer TonB [Desulfuromonas thiophila]|nr:energy transducer TonB [Desulfuromonas thiophila]
MTAFSHRPPLLLFLFVLLSLLLHLLALYLWPGLQPVPTAETPIRVQVRPLVPERETLLPRQPQPPTQPTKRLGPEAQQVVREQAPEGKAAEDSSPKPAASSPRLSSTAPQPPAATTPPPVAPVVPQTRQARQQPPPQPPAAPTTAVPAQTEPAALPSLDQLLNTGLQAAADVARDSQVKARPDVARGETVWLNMEHDLLYSFFARFRKSIYAVWNYPQESIERGQQGRALLKIIINRDGNLEDVEVVDGAPYERLNREAIAAVIKAAPYGTLPASYPGDQITIMAYFEYSLMGGPRDGRALFGR